jgi:N-methylhydantoinase A
MNFGKNDIIVQRSIDMRYRYQSHELSVAFPPGTADLTATDMAMIDAEFDRLYELTYGPGSGYRDAGKEIVTYRVSARGLIGKPKIDKDKAETKSAEAALKGRRPVYFEEHKDFVETPIYDFQLMHSGNEITGPAIIESNVTTIVVNPQNRAMMDEYRNIRLFINARGK